MYIWQYILFIYICTHTHIYIYIIPGMMVYVSTFSILRGVLNPITTWQSLGIIQCPPAHRAGGVLNLAWAEDVHDTARDFYEERNAAGKMSKFKGMSLWLLLTKQNRDTVQQWQQRPKNLLYRDRTFETQKVSTCMTVWLCWIFGVSPVPPFFWAKNLPRRNTIVTIAWRTSSWRNWRRPHRRVLDPWSWPAVLGKGWQFRSWYP